MLSTFGGHLLVATSCSQLLDLPIQTPPGLATACQRSTNPAATLTAILKIAQDRIARTAGCLTRLYETADVTTRASAPSQTRITILTITQSHGTASACHSAAKITVAIQAPTKPASRRSSRSIRNVMIVQANAATSDAVMKGKNRFMVI